MSAVSLAPLRSRLVAATSGQSYQVWFPLTVYALTRLVDLILILIAARHQIAPSQSVPGLAGYKIWDPSPASPG
jgi:hypothetical protein